MVTQHIENIARRSFFDAISRLFIAPGAAGTVAALHDGLVAADAFATELGLDAATFTRAAEADWPDETTLGTEYAKLFTGPNAISLCESDWTDVCPKVTPLAQLECRGRYLEAGLETAALNGIPEDHLGVQAGFMSVLILQEKAAEATRFFEAHPARWLPAFIERIREHPDALLFRVIADVLEAALDIEKTLREESR